MMPTNVQRPKILDMSETQSSTSRVICSCLEMVGVKYPRSLMPQLPWRYRCDGLDAGFIRRPTLNSLLNCARLLSAESSQGNKISSHHTEPVFNPKIDRCGNRERLTPRSGTQTRAFQALLSIMSLPPFHQR